MFRKLPGAPGAGGGVRTVVYNVRKSRQIQHEGPFVMNPSDPIYDDAFVTSLPDDAWDAVAQVCTRFSEWITAMPPEEQLARHERIVDAYALLRTLISQNTGHLPGIPNAVQVTHNHKSNITNIVAQFNDIHTLTQNTLGARYADRYFTASSERYEAMLAGQLRIEFHDDEIKQLQTLINELREAISGCESLEANHKLRLLGRLERLQKELHEEVSNLDSMWTFIGDAAFVLGQAAQDGKPIAELVREIMGIAGIAMGRTHGLPAGAIQDFLLQDKNVVTEPTSIEPVESPSS